MNELIPLPLPGLEISTVGARPTDLAVLDPDATTAAIAHLRQIDSASWWVLGDLVLALIHEVGEAEANRRLAEVGHDPAHVGRCFALAAAVPHRVRRPRLSWSHHHEVRRFTPDDQDRWLTRAEDAGWSIRDLRRAIADEQAHQQPQLDGFRPDGWRGAWPPRPPESLLSAALTRDAAAPVLWCPAAGGLSTATVVGTQPGPGGKMMVAVLVDPAMATQIRADQPDAAA